MLRTLRSKFIVSFLLVVIPLVGLLFYMNVYSMSIVRVEAVNSYKNLMNMYSDMIDHTLKSTSETLENISINNQHINYIPILDNGSSAYIYTKYQILESVKATLGNNEMIDTVFVYFGEYDDLLPTNSAYSDNTEQAQLRRERIYQAVANNQFYNWQVIHLGNKSMLIYLIQITKDVYVGAVIDPVKLVVPFDTMNLGKRGEAVLVSDDNTPLTTVQVAGGILPSLPHDSNFIMQEHEFVRDAHADPYLMVTNRIKQANVKFMVFIAEETILQKLPFYQRLFYIIAFIVVIVLVVYVFILRLILTKPLAKIINAMRRIETGNLDVRLQQEKTVELGVISNTFNQMAAEISNLKINIYEEQLKGQKAEYKRLQSQINPHFYMNSLNIAYNLAALKEYGLVQKLLLHISEFFRFIMKTDRDLVTLKEELNHTENYLEIQKLRYPEQLITEIRVDGSLADGVIPALAIQPFVENCVLHGFKTSRPPFYIRIHAGLDKDEVLAGTDPRILITISDSGAGFQEEMLKRLQDGSYLREARDEHLGIWNVCRRIRMTYGEEASIAFLNNDGAVIQIRIPYYAELNDVKTSRGSEVPAHV